MSKNHSADDWWLQGNFYSLYIDKFAGTITGLIDKLDYFVALGVDCLHIMPHYPSPYCDGGYDVTDHIGIRPELGTVEDFRRLCNIAHEKGLKIMVDLVLNHTSDQHPWFLEARQSTDNAKRDFYIWSKTGTEFADVDMIFPDFKDSNWNWNDATNDYFYTTYKSCQPELNWQNPDVQEAMFAVVDTLIAYGVDGFRLDAVMNLVESDDMTSINVPETHERIKDLRAYMDQYHPGTILLGEVLTNTKVSRRYFGTSNECHLVYNLELMNEMFYALLFGNRTDRLAVVLEAAKRVPPGVSWMAFLRNHDSLSLTALDDPRAEELLTAMHPEPTGRFSHGTETTQRLFNLLHEDEALVREAFSMLYALPFATVMYYGDEIGMQNAPLPTGEDDMRFISRGDFDWSLAEQQQLDAQSLWHHVRKCMHQRKGT